MEFESTFSVFRRAKIFHALNRTASVFGNAYLQGTKLLIKPARTENILDIPLSLQ
jgi:hypothetical protein